MVIFYKGTGNKIFAVDSANTLAENDLSKLAWLFGDAKHLKGNSLDGIFIGPRKEMITPWSTNAVEITQNMGIEGIIRIEEYTTVKKKGTDFDPMLKAEYKNLDQDIYTIELKPEPIQYIEDIAAYNTAEGLALSEDEIKYLEETCKRIGRKLTDGEVFGFSQVNSEHCRHKIFNGTFIIDGVEKEDTLFKMIRRTTEENPNTVVSAYKDNVAFIKGPKAVQFAPKTQYQPDFFEIKDIETVISVKAETHNFPTTVEPFNGAATGAGGEIRDRMAGGKGSIPIAGTAVYMTSYSRSEDGRSWEAHTTPRDWLYQSPEEILIKASNGASDFGNKFGQPLITGSVLTFEHNENDKKYGFDKVIMLAGGVGYAAAKDALKDTCVKDQKIAVMGGDNYRIGMGGGAVSSVDTGEFDSGIELNAVQRANPEMQKRVFNAIRAITETSDNKIVSIHDHGAGGHLNSLSELVEDTGGTIEVGKLPIGDPTLSDKEVIGNESQERMGLVMNAEDIDELAKISERERAPFYVVGDTTGEMNFTFKGRFEGNPIDLKLEDMFGKPPKTILTDTTIKETFKPVKYKQEQVQSYLEDLIQLEAVACKDWLTNKVDRSVTGKVAKQQTCGSLQLPLNNVGVVTVDYQNKSGIATSIGHSPASALIDPQAGSINAIAESLTNIVWAPLKDQIQNISLSANWMWPAKNPGENARLYSAVEAASKFALALGINIPTGKDSMSMTQKYRDGEVVYSPGTVIISAGAEVTDVTKVVEPVLIADDSTSIIYINLTKDKFKLGGSSFAQLTGNLGKHTPTVKDPASFKTAFNTLQELIEDKKILAGHDIASGGLITSLLEMCFAENNLGMTIDLSSIPEEDIIKILFSENTGVLIQVKEGTEVLSDLKAKGLDAYHIGTPLLNDARLKVNDLRFDIPKLRDKWFRTSYLLDQKQTQKPYAGERFENYKSHELKIKFNKNFTGKASQYGLDLKRRDRSGIKAAIIREKGINGDREMAYSMYLAGLDVKDVHMTDLIEGRETLEDVNMIVFTGGFSNSDVLGSAKGWAGAFLYNEKAKQALDNFYARPDTLSLGVCNGCQLMQELELIYPEHPEKPKMKHNNSRKFESSFLSVEIEANNSVMLHSLAGSQLGIWVAHGEGKFEFPSTENNYNIPMKYYYDTYPANPNGSAYNAAGICSTDGRHLAMMPHLERAIFPYQWGAYPKGRTDEVTPWIEAFVNARKWIKEKK